MQAAGSTLVEWRSMTTYACMILARLMLVRNIHTPLASTLPDRLMPGFTWLFGHAEGCSALGGGWVTSVAGNDIPRLKRDMEICLDAREFQTRHGWSVSGFSNGVMLAFELCLPGFTVGYGRLGP